MKKAILTLCVGELYWELARFVPYIIWMKINNPDLDIIVMTRKDRFDLYGEYATKFIPVEIQGDFFEKKSECFRLKGFSELEYNKLINDEYSKLIKDYDIVEKVYPSTIQYSKINQFDRTKFCYDYKPRKENKIAIDKLIFKKPIVIIAPRFRKEVPRNWIHWKEFYELLKSMNEFDFVLCGKEPEYIKDESFFDINKIPVEDNTSLIGYSIELIKKAVLTVGTQSAIPSLSLLLGTPVFQWGHNRINLMTDEYNPKKTICTFLDDHKYSRLANDIFKELKKVLLKVN